MRKKKKQKRSKELYKESIQLKKEYNEQYTKNRKHIGYDMMAMNTIIIH